MRLTEGLQLMVMSSRFNNLLVVLLIQAMSAQAEELQPFSSDGCSAFPDGTLKQNDLWLVCSQDHDFAYWKGGTYQERLTSDKELETCVSKVGEPEIALLMLAGVRVGGSPFFPMQFRWGYGWPYPRVYGKHTKQELEQIKNLTSKGAGREKAVPVL